MTNPNHCVPRRGFLRGLASLPLIGGFLAESVAPTDAASAGSLLPDLIEAHESAYVRHDQAVIARSRIEEAIDEDWWLVPVAVMPNGEHCSDSGYCDLAQLSSAEIRRIIACPSALVEAPIAIVWGLLMATAEWGRFCDIRVLSVDPPGPARPGQRLVGLTGPRFLPLRVVFDFTEIDAERHHIRMEGRLPFGLKVSENH